MPFSGWARRRDRHIDLLCTLAWLHRTCNYLCKRALSRSGLNRGYSHLTFRVYTKLAVNEAGRLQGSTNPTCPRSEIVSYSSDTVRSRPTSIRTVNAGGDVVEQIFSGHRFPDEGSNQTSDFHFDREQSRANGSVTPKRFGHECFAFVGRVTVKTNRFGQGCSKVFEAYINSPMTAGRSARVEQQDRRCPVMKYSKTLESVLITS